ncbi:unnamed protein product [Peronospora farinosa]|uniref:RxLR effector candidate protein n=3 Tax=Peronospora farinosa TaxID=134698 RepID=A0AAV0T8J5_9STRA|nr:unnamed protein product [Peronospora farinosa]
MDTFRPNIKYITLCLRVTRYLVTYFVFELFKLNQHGDIQQRTLPFDMWAKYAAKAPEKLSSEMIGKVWEFYGFDGPVRMLEDFVMADVAEGVVRDLKTELIGFWKAENTPMKEALNHLRFDKTTVLLVRERLLNTWLEYGNTKKGVTKEMVEAIDSCDDEMRVAILEDLRKIKGTDGLVKFALNHLMTYLEERKVDANLVYKFLKLDQPEYKQPRTLHFETWVRYAARSPILLSKSTLESVFNIHGDVGILELAKAYSNRRKDFSYLLNF